MGSMQHLQEDFLKTFTHNRVQIGKAIDKHELVRRLSYYLQVPHMYAQRIYDGLIKVLNDCTKHGEGVNIKDFGTLKFSTHSSRTVKIPSGEIIKRPRMYKPSFSPAGFMNEMLEELTKENYDSI
jgi:nucleoid DNA-binding protein